MTGGLYGGVQGFWVRRLRTYIIITTYIFLWHQLGEFVKDHSNFYLVIISVILITFSLDLCIDRPASRAFRFQ